MYKAGDESFCSSILQYKCYYVKEVFCVDFIICFFLSYMLNQWRFEL